jgi:nucleoside-specific outer membrane channel protein Tsx
MYKYLSTLVLLFSIFNNSHASTWSSSSISYLYGWDNKTPTDINENLEYSTYTFENSSSWKYGDSFFFTDISNSESKSTSSYTEWAPRLSSSKIFNKTYGSWLTDVSIAGQMNWPTGAQRIELYGIGLDFKIPHFTFFQINLYQRDDLALEGTTHQLTIAWDLPFTLKNQKFSFSGFIDIAGEEGNVSNTSEANTLAQPQLLWHPNKSFALGTEYLHWKNKFGIKSLNEGNLQFLAKWNL